MFYLLRSTCQGTSRVGGGALPLAAPRTRLVQVEVQGLSPTRLEQALRKNDPPIICRLEDGRLLLDPRTLLESDQEEITAALARLAA